MPKSQLDRTLLFCKENTYSKELLDQLSNSNLLINWMNQYHWLNEENCFRFEKKDFLFELINQWYLDYLNEFKKIVDKFVFISTIKQFVINIELSINKKCSNKKVSFDFYRYKDLYKQNSKFYSKDIKLELKVTHKEFLKWFVINFDVLDFVNKYLKAFYNSNNDLSLNHQIELFLTRFYKEHVIPRFGHIPYLYFKNELMFSIEYQAYLRFKSDQKANCYNDVSELNYIYLELGEFNHLLINKALRHDSLNQKELNYLNSEFNDENKKEVYRYGPLMLALLIATSFIVIVIISVLLIVFLN